MLIIHENKSILVSQKCQEDPSVRDHAKTFSWVRKNAAAAVAQLRGALRTVESKRPAWCLHPRRGRVDFLHGLPQIDHAIAIVEVFERIQLPLDDAKFPLEMNGKPTTYFSVNDFLNVAVELRTVPEIFEYLTARRSLPDSDLRVIGDEKSLFEFYLLNGGTFHGCGCRSDAASSVAKRQDELAEVLNAKSEWDKYSGLLEQVAYELATRHPAYALDLSAETLSAYDDPADRKNYLEMQAVLADLRLKERAELGRAFFGTIQSMREKDEGFSYMAAYLDAKPNWVFVCGSSKKVGHADVLNRAMILARAAMAQYTKQNCMVVIDRDQASYEVIVVRATSDFSDEELAAGKRLFGHLKISDVVCAFS